MCIPPMLAKLGDESTLVEDGLLFEPKLDGIRMICHKRGGTIALYNRHCIAITGQYPEFQFHEAIRAEECLLDGEIVWYNRAGDPDFPELMKHHQSKRGRRGSPVPPGTLRYAVFDVMSRDGADLKDLPLHERKEIVRDVVLGEGYIEHTVFTSDGPALWRAVQERSLEGVIAKQADGRYESGRRTGSWRKIKSFKTIDCVIVGYSAEKRILSSLGVALFDEDGRLQFFGKVGTGFSDEKVKQLHGMLSGIHVDEPPAAGVPRSYRGIRWVEPRYVCELRYLEIGSQGMMRNPSFLRLRPDKRPEDCTMAEQLGFATR